MSTTTVPIASYVTELRHTVQVAALNFDVWWAYRQRRDRARFVDVLNTYPLFFQTSIHAHFVALVVALYRVYETRPDTFNLPGLMRRLEDGGAVPARTLTPIRRRVSNARKLWVKVSILRNKAFAHRANAYSVADVFRRAQVKPDDLRSLLRRTQRILNKISRALDRSTHAFNLRASGDTKRMLADLKTFGVERSSRAFHGTRTRRRARTGARDSL